MVIFTVLWLVWSSQLIPPKMGCAATAGTAVLSLLPWGPRVPRAEVPC